MESLYLSQSSVFLYTDFSSLSKSSLPLTIFGLMARPKGKTIKWSLSLDFVNWKQNDWVTLLPIAEFVYNNTKNPTICHISFKLNCNVVGHPTCWTLCHITYTESC